MTEIYDFLINMDTFYQFLVGGLFLVMIFEIGGSNTPGANGMFWLFAHFWAFIASFIYVIYIFFVENLSSAGYALLYTFGYIIVEAIVSMGIITLLSGISSKKEPKK